ncbi:hypothetical protein BJ165DRAFT_1534878 [Panaeolus papilionaceus]|nr:hypothetical protein BJ165DRAFT_1534878 [Panaeolus papilionaceus]
MTSIFTTKTSGTHDRNEPEGVSVPKSDETKNKEVEVPSPPAFMQTKNKGDRDILIAVMGSTGVGKTTFIRSLTTTFDENCGHHGLDAGTKDVKAYEIDLPDLEDHLVLVDTPGFDDPTRPNWEVLEEIAKWMEETYKKGRLLNGLIYLHRITDIRFDSGASSTLSIFRKLYGGKGYQRLALVTTMWNDVQENRWNEFETKETELKTIAWGSFLQRQAKEAALVSRFNSSSNLTAKDSALKVVTDLLKQSIDSEELRTQLQIELVDEKKTLPRTEAGRAAFTLAETAKYYLRQMS